MPEISLRLIINLFLICGAAFAILKGGRAERWAALIVVANALVGQSGQLMAPGSDGFIRLANDGIAALALLGVTLSYGALWMGGMMLFFAAQFSLHSYYLVTNRPPYDYLHALVNNLNWSGIAWCLIIGTAVAWRARARRAKKAQAATPITGAPSAA